MKNKKIFLVLLGGLAFGLGIFVPVLLEQNPLFIEVVSCSLISASYVLIDLGMLGDRMLDKPIRRKRVIMWTIFAGLTFMSHFIFNQILNMVEIGILAFLLWYEKEERKL